MKIHEFTLFLTFCIERFLLKKRTNKSLGTTALHYPILLKHIFFQIKYSNQFMKILMRPQLSSK